MNKIKIISGVLAASLASAAIYAAPAMTADGTLTKAAAMAQADKHFAKMDANSDGKLDSDDRTARIQSRFAKIDADKNGSISKDEFEAMHATRAEKREDRRKLRSERKGPSGHQDHRMGGRGKGDGMKMFAMADTNGDKAVSQTEFRAAAEARFAEADTNKDGTITADERKAQHMRKRGNCSTASSDAG